jgi:hypothetical protein
LLRLAVGFTTLGPFPPPFSPPPKSISRVERRFEHFIGAGRKNKIEKITKNKITRLIKRTVTIALSFSYPFPSQLLANSTVTDTITNEQSASEESSFDTKTRLQSNAFKNKPELELF